MESDLWRQFLIQLLRSDKCSSQLAALVISFHLLEQLELTTKEDCTTVVSGLATLYPRCGADLRERVIGITRRILFPDGENIYICWSDLFNDCDISEAKEVVVASPLVSIYLDELEDSSPLPT